MRPRGETLPRILLLAVLAGLVSVRPATGQERAAAVQADEAAVDLDFQDTDIRAVISALAELMEVNVIYGELPARPVTVRTHRPVPRDSLRSIFFELLESNGLIASEAPGVLRIGVSRAATTDAEAGPTPQDDLELFVIRLRHAQAGEVAAVINALFGRGSVAPAGRSGVRRGGLSEQLREGLVPPGLPQEREEPEDRAADAPPDAESREERGAVLEGDVTIVPDISTNSLLVRATQRDFRIIRQTVEDLDVRPFQVMIEVLIAEIRRDALTQLGINVLLPEQTIPGLRDVQVEGELDERTLGNLVIRIMQLEGAQVEAIFEALSTRSDVRIISRPVLVTANNQQAHILVGSERPFIQVSRALPTEAPIRDQIVQFRDVGTKLTILPTINPDGYVNLDILQEVSAATAETQFGAPVISTREAGTQVLVNDGQTVVIGGLIDQQRERVRSGVPLLKDLPLLGALFGSSTWRTTNTELFLFLTPHVLKTDEDAQDLRRGVERAAPDVIEDGIRSLLPGDTAISDTTTNDHR